MSKFYITSAIDYVNGLPHLGHALEKVQADVIARYQRLLGKEVYFLCGTDEHGLKIVRAAQEQNKETQNFVEENAKQFKDMLKALNISNDDFIRTTDQKRHWPAVQVLWKKLKASGDIYKSAYQGLYCPGCEAFITEKDLIDGKCASHNQKPEQIKEENYFFRLSNYAKKVKSAIESEELKIIPETKRNEALSLLEKGIEDISFSRPRKNLSWGIPVPDDATQTIYVWTDALINYISALGYGSASDSAFKKYWPADAHIIGKDILRFHAIIWPAMLLSANLPLPKTILAHGFITVGSKKMAKTLGNIADPFDIIERYSADVLRYYLLREIPTFEDGDFTEEKFQEAYNANLANGLGNYVSRVSKMIEQYFQGIINKPEETLIAEAPLRKKGLESFSIPYILEKFTWPAYQKAMNDFTLKQAMDIIWDLLGELDGYVQEYQPFKLINTDRKKTQAVLWGLGYGMANIAWMLKPFLPETSDKIFKILGIDPNHKEEWRTFHITPHPPLFPRKH